MSGIRLTKVDEATIVTPPAGKVTIFANDADGEPSYKDESGTVTSLQGVAGPTGATGPGVPVAGTTGQLLAKIDGTDYNTEWVDPGALLLHAASHEDEGGDEIDVTGLSGVLADPQPTTIAQITDASAYAKTLLDDADAATARTTLGLAIGTNVQAYDAELAALAGLTSAADKGIQFTGSGTAATYDLTAAGKALLDDANAAAQLVTLGAAPLAGGTFTGAIAVPDDAYDATTWNGSVEVPTKNAIRDKIEAVIAGGGYTDEQAQDAVGAMVDASLTYVDGTPLLQRAALTGDVTASAGSNATTLATSGVTAATYGSATQVAQVAFDAKGRATSASNVSIAIAASQVTSGVLAIGRLATGTPDGTKFVRDDGTLATPSGGGGGGGAEVCCGRLTLESGVAISTSDQTGKTTIYWTPYKGANIALYDGSAWNVRAFSETSLALGTLTSGKNYDVFGYDNSGSLALELSAAWSSDTARTDALALQNGVLVKSGTTTRRYLGTFRTTSTTATEDSGGGGTTQVGGKRFVWNYYNRVRRDLSVIDTTDSWTYTTGTIRQANAASGNKVELVIGVNEDAVLASATSSTLSSGSSVQSRTGVGLDSTTAITGIVGSASTNGLVHQTITGFLSKTVGIGYHYLAWLESGNGSSSTWYGDNAGASQTGLTANVMG